MTSYTSNKDNLAKKKLLRRNLPPPPPPPKMSKTLPQPPSFAPPLAPQSTEIRIFEQMLQPDSKLIAEIEAEFTVQNNKNAKNLSNFENVQIFSSFQSSNNNLLQLQHLNNSKKIVHEVISNIQNSMLVIGKAPTANLNEIEDDNELGQDEDEDRYSISHKFADFDDDEEFDLDLNENLDINI